MLYVTDIFNIGSLDLDHLLFIQVEKVPQKFVAGLIQARSACNGVHWAIRDRGIAERLESRLGEELHIKATDIQSTGAPKLSRYDMMLVVQQQRRFPWVPNIRGKLLWYLVQDAHNRVDL